MNETAIDFSSGRFDFSRDSLIRESLLERLMSRQAGKSAESAGSRTPVSLDELTREQPVRGSRRENRGCEPPARDKGRDL